MKACRRLATRRQASPPLATDLWITDADLKRSFHRFQCRFIASSRGLSLHRGPLESRRRLGKRHMGAVMSSPPTYRHLWHFEVMGTLNEWKWEPPTSSAQRREREGRMSLSNLGDRLVKWLEASDFDKPYLQPPLEANIRAQAHRTGLAHKIADMRTSLCLLDEVNQQTLDRWAYKLRRTLTNRITSGHVMVGDLILAMHPLDSITWQRIGDDELARSFTTTIQTYIVSTLGRMRRKDNEGMFLEAWLAVAQEVTSMPASNAAFTVLRYLVKEANSLDSARLSSELLLDKSRSFLLTQSDRSISSPGWLLRFARFAQMLGRMDTKQRITIDSGLVAYVLRYSSVTGPDKARDLQYSWLLLQAHLDSLPSTAFETALCGFMESHGPLNEYEAWQLATARLLALRLVNNDQHRQLVAGKSEPSRQRWHSLASSIRGHDDLAHLCDALRNTQCSDSLLNALVSYGPARRRNGAIHRIVSHPRIDHRLIWDAIDSQRKVAMRMQRGAIGSHRSGRSHARIRSLLGLVDRMAVWYETAPSLSSRQAFRGIELCVKAQLAMSKQRGQGKGRISHAVLSSLTEVIIRDMRTGTGRTERLKYLLHVISEQRGQAEAQKARAVLQGWRQKIQETQGF